MNSSERRSFSGIALLAFEIAVAIFLMSKIASSPLRLIKKKNKKNKEKKKD